MSRHSLHQIWHINCPCYDSISPLFALQPASPSSHQDLQLSGLQIFRLLLPQRLPPRLCPLLTTSPDTLPTPPKSLLFLIQVYPLIYLSRTSILTQIAPTHATSDVPNLPSSSVEYEPIPSSVIVSRPSPHPTSIPGVLPPYPTSVSFPSGSPEPSVLAPTGTGIKSTSSTNVPPEFTGAAAAIKVPVVVAGVFGLAALVL